MDQCHTHHVTPHSLLVDQDDTINGVRFFQRRKEGEDRWSVAAETALETAPSEPISLTIYGGSIESAGPASPDEAVDLCLGKNWVLAPGLINAHDHLELNTFPLLGENRPYGNFYQWADEVRAGWDRQPLPDARALPLTDRLRLGGFKNLLNGVTTVCHHNPFHRCLNRNFPVYVVPEYRFLQSVDRSTRVERRCARRGRGLLFAHVADGTDNVAQGEFDRLTDIVPVDDSTVLVHGLGMTEAQVGDAGRRRCRIVWCPVSNNYLYSAVAPVDRFLSHMPTSLGSDASVSGSHGLLDDLRFAAEIRRIHAAELASMVCGQAARVLGLDRCIGCLAVGSRADLLVYPLTADSPQDSLLRLRRRDVGLVIGRGRPLYGDAEFSDFFKIRGVAVEAFRVDGKHKLVDRELRIPWETLRRARTWTPLWQGVTLPGE